MTQHPRAGYRLMHVHAHPDDESSKGAASTAKYVAEGVDVHVVTCTGGERGSILNPKMDRPEILENITEIRRQEMERARDILGVRQDWLGFVDSGWPEGDPPPPLPEGCFALVPVEEAAEPLVRLIREFRPHVVTTYDELGGYPHPDHIRTHEVTMHALRPYLLRERGLPREDVSISGYWRRGRTEESFRQWKRELAATEDPAGGDVAVRHRWGRGGSRPTAARATRRGGTPRRRRWWRGWPPP